MGWRRERGPRSTGEPTGGVSSWHLWWKGLEGDDLVEVAATIEVTVAPTVERLYFWALQASFTDRSGTDLGAAHLGPQWNPRHPDHRAVNWGGYARPPAAAILDGTPSPLPSTPDDPNARDYPWQPATAYRLRIRRGEQGWRGEVTDTSTGTAVAVRELLAGGDRLRSPVMWSEVFCRCDHPPAEVRWSDLEAMTADGRVVRPSALHVNFPTGTAGDCENTDVLVEAGGAAVRQRSGSPRTYRVGAPIRWSPPPPHPPA